MIHEKSTKCPHLLFSCHRWFHRLRSCSSLLLSAMLKLNWSERLNFKVSDLPQMGNVDPQRKTELAPCPLHNSLSGSILFDPMWVLWPELQFHFKPEGLGRTKSAVVRVQDQKGVALLSIKLQSTSAGGQGWILPSINRWNTWRDTPKQKRCAIVPHNSTVRLNFQQDLSLQLQLNSCLLMTALLVSYAGSFSSRLYCAPSLPWIRRLCLQSARRC